MLMQYIFLDCQIADSVIIAKIPGVIIAVNDGRKYQTGSY